MNKKRLASNALMLSGALLFSQAAFALGLGEVQIHSKLNQTLDAEIEILSATQEELNALSVSVPSIDIFSRYDIERSRLVSNLQFNVEKRGDNRHVIRISSLQPVQEPFVTFLVQADWNQGKLLREYTVLVDPPTFVPGASSATTYSDPATGSTYSTGTITRGDSVNIAPDYQSSETYRIPDTGDGTRMVQRGDTLSKIAGAVKPSSVNLNQAMLAIYRANPDAFDGNINRLRAGKRLRIPNQTEFGQIDRTAAASEVNEQMADWRAGRRSTGKLELRVPDLVADETPASIDSGIGTTGSESDGSALDSSEKLVATEMEEKLKEYERLLASRDNDIATLQEQLRELQEQGVDVDLSALTTDIDGSAGVDPATSETGVIDELDTNLDSTTDPVDQIDTGDLITDASTNEVDSSPDDSNTAEIEEDPEPETTPVTTQTPVVTTPPVEQAPWWMKWLKWLGGLLGLLGLGLLGFFGYKKFGDRQPDRDSLFVDDELDSAVADIAASVKEDVHSRYTGNLPVLEDQSDLDDTFEAAAPAGLGSGTVETPQLEVGDIDIDEVADESSAYNEDDASLPDFDTEMSAEIDVSEQTISIADTSIESDAALPFEETTLADATNFSGSIELDQNNPIAEADFHMAYGLYDQATELVKGALAEEDKIEFREKLLEIYFVSGNQEEFVNYAAQVKADMQDKHPAIWDNVAIMGKQLAPEEALFSGELNAADSDEGLDFAFGAEETGDLEIDQSLFGDPDESQVSDGIDLNFDLDAELNDDEGDAAVEDALDLDLASSELEVSDNELSLDLALEATGEVEMPAAGPDLTEILDTMPDTDGTHQVESVDLDLDIGSQTGATEEISDLDNLLDATSDTLEIAGASSLDFDMGELGLPNAGDVGAELTQLDDSEMTMDFGADDNTLETGEFNFDKALFGVDDDPFSDATLTDMSESPGVELPGSLTGDDEHASTSQISDDDLARMGLSNEAPEDNVDMMDATHFGFDDDIDLGDEVSTKLDLARAYIEMDDAENAKSILNEVISEGSETQAQEAKDLLSGLS